MLERSDLFDAELVARLTRRDVPGPPSPHPARGIHRSPRRGGSVEFSEHAEYTPGDDLRHLDWKIYAKSDRYFVKRHEDERVQRAVFLVDASGSMAYGAAAGGVRDSKYHLAARISVALTACLLHQGDSVGVEVAGSQAPGRVAPKGGAGQLEAVIEVLGGVVPLGTARISESCAALGERLGKGAAVFVVSDFLDEAEERLEGVRSLRARGCSPRMVHLLHADELDLPFENTTRFLDLEGPSSLVLDPLAVRRAYGEEIRAFTDRLARAAELLGVAYVFLSSGGDPAPALTRLLQRLGRS